MKGILIKFQIIFVVVLSWTACAKVTQTQSIPVDTQATVKADTPVKTKPDSPVSTSQLSKALYIQVIGASGNQNLFNVTVTIKNCRPDTIAPNVYSTVCSPFGAWQTDANGSIFVDSTESMGKPGNNLQFALSKENYWSDSSGYLIIQPGPNKADTITFRMYAVSWLRIHLQDSIPADSGHLQMYFVPDWVNGPGGSLPFPPSTNSNIQMSADPSSLVGYLDHLKFFSPGVNTTFLIKTTGSTNNQIFIERYIGYYDKPGLYTGLRVVNDFDTLDWDITLH
jgi:hypothetical protein